MSIPTPQLGVLIMDDGGEFGDRACQRIPQVRPTSVRLALEDAPDRPGIRTVERVPKKKFTLRTAINAAAAEGIFMIAAPRNVQDPLSALVDATRGAAGALDEDHPGFAIAFMEPLREVYKIAAVADLADPVTTGLSAWAAVAIAAARYGSSVDVLVLGADTHQAPETWETGMHRFNMTSDGEELVRDALERAEAHGVTLKWVPLGKPTDRPAAVLRAVVEGGYDLVIDDVPPVNVGLRLGRRRRVEEALNKTGGGSTAYRLVKDAPCDVMVVLDAARLGILSPDLARAGAATVALGVVGVGAVSTPTSNASKLSANASMPSQLEATLDIIPEIPLVEESEEEAPAEEAEAPAGEAEAPAEEAPPAPPLESLPLQEQLNVVRQQIDEASAARDAAAAAAADQEAAHLQAEAERQAAASQLEELQPQLEQLQQEADEAAKDARLKTVMASGPWALLPGGPSTSEVKEVRQEAQHLREMADEVQAQADAIAERLQSAEQVSSDAWHQMSAQRAEAERLAAEVDAKQAQARDIAYQLNPTAIPVAGDYYISTVFGQAGRYWSSGYHTGLDFAASTGTNVVAAKRGTVVQAGWGGAYGNMVVIEHEDGHRTRYAHLSQISVSVGQQVSAGERVGAVGSTGNSTGPHLHFELMGPDGGFRNPAPWLGM